MQKPLTSAETDKEGRCSKLPPASPTEVDNAGFDHSRCRSPGVRHASRRHRLQSRRSVRKDHVPVVQSRRAVVLQSSYATCLHSMVVTAALCRMHTMKTCIAVSWALATDIVLPEGVAWLMWPLQAGWRHARYERKVRKSASPCQYTSAPVKNIHDAHTKAALPSGDGARCICWSLAAV